MLCFASKEYGNLLLHLFRNKLLHVEWQMDLLFLYLHGLVKIAKGIWKTRLKQRATRVRFQETLSPVPDGRYAIEYTRSENWRVHIGAESYFFQEGKSAKYQKAKYGGMKVDNKGNRLLIGLFQNPDDKIE